MVDTTNIKSVKPQAALHFHRRFKCFGIGGDAQFFVWAVGCEEGKMKKLFKLIVGVQEVYCV